MELVRSLCCLVAIGTEKLLLLPRPRSRKPRASLAFGLRLPALSVFLATALA